MRIALINTISPFIRGGAEILVDDLKEQLEIFGHRVTLFRIPFPGNMELLFQTIVSARMLRLERYDRVIAFKFPAYCVRHPAKVMWMFHQFRQAYELEGTEFGLPNTPEAARILDIVRAADNVDIPRSRHIYTNAYEVSKRLEKYNKIKSEVLPPPLKEAEKYECREQGDYIFCPSRINELKRQHLLVEAMKYTKSDVKLIIAGQCPDAGYMENIHAIITENNLEGKVEILNRWITDDEKISLMAKCLAGAYIPYKEDSCGFVTMEAQYSHKPVITCIDSGGTAEFIEEGKSGYFADPNPRALAQAMDKLQEDKKNAENMGEYAFEDITRKNITWENTVRRLLK